MELDRMTADPPRIDRWGRSIEKMERELADAWTALDAAALATAAALDAVYTTRTDAAEDRAWSRWQKAHDAQNRAARRLHDANRALGRPACAERRSA
jgi:hypothetical protein